MEKTGPQKKSYMYNEIRKRPWPKINNNTYISICPQDYDAKDLNDFEETILRGVGYDAEGKIARKELTMILLALASKQPLEEEH
jgi:hypothetical protein